MDDTKSSIPMRSRMYGLNNVCEYETSRVVTVRNIPLSLFKLIAQILVFALYIAFHFSHNQGFQTFAQVRSIVTTKVLNMYYIQLYILQKT